MFSIQVKRILIVPVFILILVGCDESNSDSTHNNTSDKQPVITSKTDVNANLSINDCKDNNNYSCISVLDSGQGNCVVISCRNGDQIIADCGGESSKAPSIKAFLKAVGAYDNNLSAVVISHPHTDHYNLLPSVLVKEEMSFDHRDRFLIDVANKGDYKPSTFQSWYASMTEGSGAKLKHTKLQPTHYDDPGHPHTDLRCTGAASDEGIYVMAANVGSTIPLSVYEEEHDPNSPCYDQDDDGPLNSQINDRSIVLKFHRSNFDMILPGDAGNKVEKKILERYTDADFLKTTTHLLSHHGSCYGVNHVKWVETIKPDIIIASAAQNDGYSHPRCTTTSLYKNKSTITDAATHAFGCYQARRKYKDDPSQNSAVYNTFQSKLIVLRYDENNKTYDLWTCPGNTISSACTKGVPK